VLGFLAPAPLLLVEAPESGMHPARVRGLVAALRELHASAGTQVVVATHSPLVIDEMRPEEVTVVTQPNYERGTVATHEFLERARVAAAEAVEQLFVGGTDARLAAHRLLAVAASAHRDAGCRRPTSRTGLDPRVALRRVGRVATALAVVARALPRARAAQRGHCNRASMPSPSFCSAGPAVPRYGRSQWQVYPPGCLRR